MSLAPDPPLGPQASALLAEDHLLLALAAGRIGTWELLGNPPTLLLSAELQHLLGLADHRLDTAPKKFLQHIHPGDRASVLKNLLKSMRNAVDAEFECRFLRPDQPPAHWLARARFYRDPETRTARLIGVGIDLTARSAGQPAESRHDSDLERQLAQRTAQLQATEKELESFCYSISHDLRAPLRSVRGFNEVLLERYAANLDGRAQEFLRRACEASQHMDQLIDGLLKLSRLGRAELSKRCVDLSQLARAIADELTAGEPARAVTFKIAPGLSAVGDERLLRVVLENLLRNAWKFTAKQPQALIEFGSTATPEPAFFVRDNGAGFDPEYGSRLFGVFQRLHSSAEFPGIGVGLAMVQRVITRHGGRVWASGSPGAGATFYFLLPRDENL